MEARRARYAVGAARSREDRIASAQALSQLGMAQRRLALILDRLIKTVITAERSFKTERSS